MKLNIVIIFIFILSIMTAAQNKKIMDHRTMLPMLIGEVNRQAFKDSAFSGWFNSGYRQYEVDSALLKDNKGMLNDYDIVLVFGSWCHDSRREVPRLLKILDYLNYPKDKIKIYAVNRYKEGLNNEVDSLNVKKVPSLIIYKENKEIGRLIEKPKETWEKDLVNIILKK